MAMLSSKSAWSWAVTWAVIFTVSMTVFPFALFASGPDAPAVTYHASTSEVRVSFFATDENNRLIENVNKDDFAVVDSGVVIRNFRSLAHAEETALDIVVLIDASESVAPRFRTTVDDVLQLSSHNDSSRDHFSVITFAGLEPTLLCDGNCGAQWTNDRLCTTQAAGTTPLFDALVYAASLLSRRSAPGVRQVILLLSDGRDTVSRNTARDAFQAVIATGATIYAVDLNAADRSPLLAQMAEATGGRTFAMSDDAGRVLQAVLADERASYLVTYQLPSHRAGFHSLALLPKHNLNLRFHCRKGYYYEDVR
jgi:VWFA-related protein